MATPAATSPRNAPLPRGDAFADLEIVTNRVSKLEANLKKPRPAKEKEIEQHELAVLQRLIAGAGIGRNRRRSSASSRTRKRRSAAFNC